VLADPDDNLGNTIIILHDACYGHRYARPKTNKTTLGLIVERPERIQASVMGISAAYIRLGERYEGGRYEPDPRRELPTEIPFKICKTSRTIPLNASVVTRVHGNKWMDELKVMCDVAGQKLATTGRETERPPDPTQKNKPVLHSGDLYLSQESLAAFEGALGGVCEGVDQVFQGTLNGHGPSQAFVCIRPPGHHCSSDLPSGFCWLNNVHVGIQHAVQEYGLTHAAIIDFDLHHGDGSQSIAWDHNEKVLNMPKNKPNSSKTSIGYFSLHDINSYPCENGETSKIVNASVCIENAHNQSVWNVHLQPWKDEAEFWELYENKYMVLIEKARSFLRHQTIRLLNGGANQPRPRAAIFISAGFDASEHETPNMQRHTVNVPTDFYARFTRDIVALAQEEGTSVDGRVISVLEGGYSDKALISGVLSHVSGLCHGHSATSKSNNDESDLVSQMANMTVGLSGLPITGPVRENTLSAPLRYNSEWWISENLDHLVHLLNPAAPPPAFTVPKKPRTGAYSSPTHASTMKVVDLSKVRRATSGNLRFGTSSISPSRAATPPPPSVDWATATHELCKLLIPTGRTTTSFTATELAMPKVKKERHSTIGLTSGAAPVQAGRQLRERSKAPANDRRKTIAVSETPDVAPHEPNGVALARRRSSVASTVSTVSTVSVRPVAVKKTRVVKPAGSDVRKASGNLSQRPQQAKISPPPGSAEVLKANGNATVGKTGVGPQRLKINVRSESEQALKQPKTTVRKAPVKAPKAAAPKKPAAKAKAVTAPGPADTVSPPTPPVGEPIQESLAGPSTTMDHTSIPQPTTPQQPAPTTRLPAHEPATFSHDPLSFQPQPQPPVTATHNLTWATPYAGPQTKSSPVEAVASPVAAQQQVPKPLVFPSNGFIPFANATPVTGQHADAKSAEAKGIEEASPFLKEVAMEADIWDVPTTPAK
jgi:histone deacetylase HOS3